jgi:UDP-N-acetylmuramoyl-L-alanyl-D-glutamate--2,6-diaminopimelate ligase
MQIPLFGAFNVSNTLAAVSCAIAKGASLKKIAQMVRNFPKIPGRLERVETKEPIDVFVDFAHTDDALEQVLVTLKEFSQGRILTVFGCGGNRDQEKRPRMAHVAERFSNHVWVTNDNPRKEPPEMIAEAIVQGFSKKASFTVELDRRKAIEQAILEAKENDIVLIAGRGHESQQIFSHNSEKLDDREEARRALKNRCTFQSIL